MAGRTKRLSPKPARKRGRVGAGLLVKKPAKSRKLTRAGAVSPGKTRLPTATRKRPRSPIRRKPFDVEPHMKLVHGIVAKRLRGMGLPAKHQLGEEMRSAGMEALVRAGRSYQRKKGAFSTFATPHIKHAIGRMLRQQEIFREGERKIIRREQAGGARPERVGLEQVKESESSGGIEHSEHKIRLTQLVKRAGIKGRDLKILQGSALHSQAALARKFGMSKTNINKILKRLHAKMRSQEKETT